MKIHLTSNNIDIVLNKVSEFAVSNYLSEDVTCRLKLIADEIVSNIINYSHAESMGDGVVVALNRKNNDIKVKIVDEGKQFNPLMLETPDIEASLEDRKIGGLGIYLVRQFAKEVRYQRKDAKNILTIVLTIE